MNIKNIKRDMQGRFSSFKTKMIRAIKFAMFWSFIAGLIVGAFWLGVSTNDISYAAERIVNVDNLSKKIEELKWEVVDGIEACESAGYKEDDGIIVFDSNNKASVGMLQWQKTSVIHYYKTFYQKEITPKEAVLIALDTQKARELAYEVIFKEKDGAKNWWNCAKKSKAFEKIEVIKKLSE